MTTRKRVSPKVAEAGTVKLNDALGIVEDNTAGVPLHVPIDSNGSNKKF